MQLVHRRLAFKCTAIALWNIIRSVHSLTAAATEPQHKPVSWNEFIDRIRLLADERSRGELASLSFARSVAALGLDLNMADSTLREACSFVEHRKLSKASPLVLAETHREVSFDIVLLSLDGGYSIPLHDHPMRTGISVCVSGEVIVSNYDLQASSGAISLLLRSRRTIRAGEASTLTETVGNIHTITATQHTQLIDIFSPAGPNNGRFHRYKVASDSKGGTTLKVTSID